MSAEIEDVDMTTSALLQPASQNHDRDADMHEAETVENLAGLNHVQTNTTDHDSSGDWVDEDEDAMDLTPDHTPAPQDIPSLPLPHIDVALVPPPPPGPSQIIRPPAAPMSDRDNGSNRSRSRSRSRSQSASVVEERGGQPSGTAEGSEDSSEEDYDDELDEDVVIYPEDTSAPTEEELKEMKEKGEIDGSSHGYWEQKLVPTLDDPEYRLAATGRIEWTINHFQGTKESPNRELLMKSPIVNIGGYDWQIKAYPRGNDSDHISVYVECLSVSIRSKGKQSSQSSQSSIDTNPKEQPSESPSIASIPIEYQQPVIPLLDGKKIQKRPAVAAQATVVAYNPAEPRTFVERTCYHRFCPTSPDWGWTRYHGPWYEIGNRQRGQRQALLRNDKLAFTAYIRIVEDDTGYLWEHTTKENPWDCFAMTGLQGLISDRGIDRAFVPAIASWVLFKPFRALITRIPTPNPYHEQHGKQKPLVAGFQRLIFSLRTIISPEDVYRKPISIRPIADAIPTIPGYRYSPVAVWEVLGNMISQELAGTPFQKGFDRLFGAKRNRITNKPNYRLSLKGVNSVQEAIDKSIDLVTDDAAALLHLELERDEFDQNGRRWKKILKKVKIDEFVTVNGQDYTLFGFIVHYNDINSNDYAVVLRPEGPGTGWYQISDRKNHLEGRDERIVLRLTEREAFDLYEGTTSEVKEFDSKAVATVLLYVKDGPMTSAISNGLEPQWTPAHWIPKSVISEAHGIAWYNVSANGEIIKPSDKPQKQSFTFAVRAVSSQALLEAPGTKLLDLWNQGYENLRSKGLLHEFELNSEENSDALKAKIASFIDADPEHLRCWAFNPHTTGTILMLENNPKDHPFGDIPDSDRPQLMQKWVFYHFHSEEERKLLGKDPQDAPKDEPRQGNTTETSGAGPSQPPQPSTGDDTVMSEAEESPVEPPITSIPPPRNRSAMPPRYPIVPPSSGGESSRTWARLGGAAPPPPMPPSVGNTLMMPPIPPPPMFASMASAEPTLASLVPHHRMLDAIPPGPSITTLPLSKEVYFILKTWEPETQSLKAIGFFLAKSSARVDHTLQKILKIGKEPSMTMYCQRNTLTLETIKKRRDFNHVAISTGSVIIVQRNSAKESKVLRVQGAFADLDKYLLSAVKDQLWPDQNNSMGLPVTLDYFGSEHYVGPLLSHLAHGEGRKTYSNGDMYVGAFALGTRHGKGRMVFYNGDTYDGDWVEDAQEGHGKYIEGASGNVYEGGWLGNRKHGEGVTHWKKAEEAEKLCRVCYETAAEAAFYDCGHVVACLPCARRVDVCPICRKRVVSAIKLYYTV